MNLTKNFSIFMHIDLTKYSESNKQLVKKSITSWQQNNFFSSLSHQTNKATTFDTQKSREKTLLIGLKNYLRKKLFFRK